MIHISDKLKELLQNIEDPNIYDLLINTNSEIDYLDISHSDPSKISYITEERKKQFKEKYPEFTNLELETMFWKKSRYLAKPGKVMRKILSSEKLSDKSVQSISNHYKGLIEKKQSDFQIVNGYDIKKYFHYSYYENPDYGTLAQSCMRHSKTQDLLNFYAENKNIKMLILFSKNNPDTITGRALTWETEEGYKIMDRVYSIDSHYDYMFYEWANDNDHYRKEYNNWYNTTNFISPDNKKIELNLSVKLKVTERISYPYLDTFKWLDNDGTIYNYLPKNTIETNNGKLNYNGRSYNSYKSYDFKPTIKVLINLDGGYSNYDTLIYDSEYKYFRPKSEMAKCSYLNIYTHKDRVVYSSVNNDNILQYHYMNDSTFGPIFNKKFDKFNNKKTMMSFILNKVKDIYNSGYINNSKFEFYKKRFKELETEQKELVG